MKYRWAEEGLEVLGLFSRDQIDSPPVPVAVGSPAWAKKSFDTSKPLV